MLEDRVPDRLASLLVYDFIRAINIGQMKIKACSLKMHCFGDKNMKCFGSWNERPTSAIVASRRTNSRILLIYIHVDARNSDSAIFFTHSYSYEKRFFYSFQVVCYIVCRARSINSFSLSLGLSIARSIDLFALIGCSKVFILFSCAHIFQIHLDCAAFSFCPLFALLASYSIAFDFDIERQSQE